MVVYTKTILVKDLASRATGLGIRLHLLRQLAKSEARDLHSSISPLMTNYVVLRLRRRPSFARRSTPR